MNLNNLNLVELKAQEVEEIEGGLWWPLLWYALEVINNPTESANSFQDGRDFANKYI